MVNGCYSLLLNGCSLFICVGQVKRITDGC
jgi:hypothetical protein